MPLNTTSNESHDSSTLNLYQAMWSYIQTFPLKEFIVEQNFKNWFDQMVEVGRLNDIEFCVNYAKKFSGTKTYALLSEFENIKAWSIDEQSMFINAKDVFENMYFIDTPAPANGDLLRGTRNEPFAREEFMEYLREIYPDHQGYSVIQREDLVHKLSNFNSSQYAWFGGTPDDIIEIRHTSLPSVFIMPDYKCPKPGNITSKIEPEYKHQLHHYDLGCDILHAEDPTFPLIDALYLVKFNVEDQSILTLESQKDQAYKVRIVEACEMWWNEFALAGIVPPIQNDFTGIITAADFSDLQTKATDAIRLRDPDFKIDDALEERINSIPTLLYDYSVVKKMANEIGKLASDINTELTASFDLIKRSGVLPADGELTLGCGSIKWGLKRTIQKDALLDVASRIGISVEDYCTKTLSIDYYKALEKIAEVSSALGKGINLRSDFTITEITSLCSELDIDIGQFLTEDINVRQDDLMKAIELYVRENHIDVDLSHLYVSEDNVSIALSRKRTGTVASFGESIVQDAKEFTTNLIEAKQGFSSHLIINQQQEFTDRLAYQSRSKRFAENVLSLLDEDNRYTRSPIPRQTKNHSTVNDYAVVTFSGDIIEIDSGEVIGNINELKQPGMVSATTEINASHSHSDANTAPAVHNANPGTVLAQLSIKSRNITAEARGRVLVQLERKIESINNVYGEGAVTVRSSEYNSDIQSLLGNEFNLADELSKKRNR